MRVGGGPPNANNISKLPSFEQAGYSRIDCRCITRSDPTPDFVAVVQQDQRRDCRHVVLVGQRACIALNRRHGDPSCVFKLMKARSALQRLAIGTVRLIEEKHGQVRRRRRCWCGCRSC